MKRLIMLAVLCAFVLGAATAHAADIKASGAWAIEALWVDNWGLKDKAGADKGDNNADKFGVQQRADVVFEFIANENLKAVMYTRYGTGTWGQNSFEIGQGDRGVNSSYDASVITVRQAYLDFNYPDTAINVKAGYQGVTLPNAFGGGSMILSEEVASAVVTGAITDNVGFLAGYARAFSDGDADNGYIDAYIAALPMTFDGFQITPFGMYAPIGGGITVAELGVTDTKRKLAGLAALNASDTHTTGSAFDNAYWLGAAFTMDLFDPFVLKADFNYGAVQSDANQNERSGWLFDAALEYKGFDFMTPEAFFVYTSGEDGNASKGNGSSERMPGLAAGDWAVGSFFFGGGRLLTDDIAKRNDYMGFWALGLSLKDIQSFAEGLTHHAHFIYAKGTNDKDTLDVTSDTSSYNVTYGRTLTEKDTLWEVDFNTDYKLYDELTLYMDLGYFNLNTKKERWGGTEGYKGGDAYKVSTGIVYKF